MGKVGKHWDLDWARECEKSQVKKANSVEDGARGTLRAVALSPSGGGGHVRDEDDEAPDPERGGSRGIPRGGDEDT